MDTATFALALAAAAQTGGCPVHDWCVTDHDETRFGAPVGFHYSEPTGGPVTLSLDIDTHGAATVELLTGHADGARLGLDETDALLAALSAHRERMAALHAQMTASATKAGA